MRPAALPTHDRDNEEDDMDLYDPGVIVMRRSET